MRKGSRKAKPRRVRKTAPDWAQIKAEFEANRESIRGIAHWHGIAEGTVRHRAKIEGWLRRPQPDTRPVAEPRPSTETEETQFVRPALATTATAEPQELAERGRGLVSRLLDELDADTAYLGEIEQAIISESAGDKTGGRRYAMQKAVSLPARAMVMKNLAAAAKTLTEIEQLPGKKAAAQGAAERVGAAGSKFATPGMPPTLVVNNA